MWLKAGVNSFRVENTLGHRARVDYVRFSYTGSPVESASWGRIKSIYR